MAIKFAYPFDATPLDPDEAAGLIPSHISNNAQLNEWEMANILEGELWAFSRKPKNILEIDFIRRLHKRMFGNTWQWAGTFRTTEKSIGIDPLHIQPSPGGNPSLRQWQRPLCAHHGRLAAGTAWRG